MVKWELMCSYSTLPETGVCGLTLIQSLLRSLFCFIEFPPAIPDCVPSSAMLFAGVASCSSRSSTVVSAIFSDDF